MFHPAQLCPTKPLAFLHVFTCITPHTHPTGTLQSSQSCPSPAAPLNNHRQTVAWIHNGYALRPTQRTRIVPVCISLVSHTTHLLHVPFRTPVPAKLHVHRDKPSSQLLIMTAVRCCSTCRLRYHTTHPLHSHSPTLAELPFACCSPKQP